MKWPSDESNCTFDLSGPPFVFNHPYFDFRVYLDPKFVGEKLASLIRTGDYELMDLDLFDLYIQSGDRVVDIGGGIGIAAAFCAKKSKKPVVVVEANKSLHNLILKQAEVNSVVVEPVFGAVVANEELREQLDFYFHEEFWRSTTTPAESQYKKVSKVPAMGLAVSLEKYPADVLIVDIEGAEVGLFRCELKAKPRLIFVEIHVPNIGERASSRVFADLTSQGYRLSDFRAWMFMFERDT